MEFSISHRDAILYMGGIYEYIPSHHFGYWHKYIENVNMTYINCSFNIHHDDLPKYENRFYINTRPSEVCPTNQLSLNTTSFIIIYNFYLIQLIPRLNITNSMITLNQRLSILVH